jgi:hypothetical protein
MKEGGDWMWLWQRCYACGHRLRCSASACPQCGESFDGRDEPTTWPEQCRCERCSDVRKTAQEEASRT